MSTRVPAVAGYFYDADASRLREHINQFLGADAVDSAPLPEALIVPHAGYVYSGPTAASAYRCLQQYPDQIDRVLLIGPAHRVAVVGMAIPSVDHFATPLGEVELNRQTLTELSKFDGVEISDEAHRQEHCLEVQLPFLQIVLNQFTLIPVLVGGAEAHSVANVIDSFGADPATLVVISSDLSHFLDYDAAEEIDSVTCDRILDKATDLVSEQACGARAINGLMASVVGRSWDIRLLSRCNSGDTAGSRDRVVGYGAFALD